MGKVSLDMSMSLDGFITGPNDSIEHGLGEGGERLHDWIFSGDADRTGNPRGSAGDSRNAAIMDELFATTGAVIMGIHSFEVAEKPWGDNPPFQVPVFVLSHKPHEKLVKQGGTTFTFVTDGIESALKQAQIAAGDKIVRLHGANIAQQYIKAGLVDDIYIHLVPVLLGDGRLLFEHLGAEHVELESTSVVVSPGVTHLRFRVIK
jgi:dihydrofolate reductase